MVGGIPGPGNVFVIPLVNVPCIGVDKDAALRLFKLHAGTCRGFDIRKREVPKIDAVGLLLIAVNVALVFDVQVAGGVHRQHLAAAEHLCLRRLPDIERVASDLQPVTYTEG